MTVSERAFSVLRLMLRQGALRVRSAHIEGVDQEVKCALKGCGRGPATGDALHRTSPKGEDFEGLCTEHMLEHGGEPEALAVLIEDHNHGRA